MNVFMHRPPNVPLAEMVPMYRGAMAMAASYALCLGNANWSAMVERPGDPNVGIGCREEHVAMDAYSYLVHAYASVMPPTDGPSSGGVPAAFETARRLLWVRASEIDGGPATDEVSREGITEAAIASIADTAYLLRVVGGLPRMGIRRLAEYPAWNLDGASMTEVYLSELIRQSDWSVMFQAVHDWEQKFSEPVGSDRNVRLATSWWVPN